MPESQRLAIMGCGSGGSYLYRLLRLRRPDLDITLFDEPTTNSCGIKGCAWGLSRPLFVQLCEEVGFNADKYVIGKYERVNINGKDLRADLVIINKPVLINDFIGEAKILVPDAAGIEKFDRIIDATGYERAFLPPVDAPPIMSAVQVRLKTKAPQAPTAVFNPGGGYSWLFPIGESEVHLGSLSPYGFEAARTELKQMMKDSHSEVVCTCKGKIRCHGPASPITHGNVWGIGEAIGLVDPVTGAGIIPAMTSAKLLVDHWESAEYQSAILQKYAYMKKEANVLNRLMAGHLLSSSDLFFPKQALDTIGISPGFFELAGLVMSGAKDYLAHRPNKDKQDPLQSR
jgi:flavin-dependent dehydrogenase